VVMSVPTRGGAMLAGAGESGEAHTPGRGQVVPRHSHPTPRASHQMVSAWLGYKAVPAERGQLAEAKRACNRNLQKAGKVAI